MAKADLTMKLEEIHRALSDGYLIRITDGTDDRYETALIDTIRTIRNVRGLLNDFKADAAFYNQWAEWLDSMYAKITRMHRVYVSFQYGPDREMHYIIRQKYGNIALLKNLNEMDPEWLISVCDYVKACRRERKARLSER